MIENIIFYSILLFFAMLGLGMTWNTRNKCIALKVVISVSAPVLLAAFLYSKPEFGQFFDIRFIFSWLAENTGIEGRIKTMATVFGFCALCSYFVNLVHIILAAKNA